ncbi:MAG TPA: hypothetical protein VF319_01135 [Caldimonas sp.]
MKEYRLVSWPEMPVQFQRIGHRRILGAMSHRHLTVAQLVECSGLRRPDVLLLIQMLETEGHVAIREAPSAEIAPRPLGWLRRALATAQDSR